MGALVSVERVPSVPHPDGAESVSPLHDAADLKAAVRLRPAQLTPRVDTASKSRLVLLTATVVALLTAPGLAPVTRVVVPAARPALRRRRYSISLRAPPGLQLA